MGPYREDKTLTLLEKPGSPAMRPGTHEGLPVRLKVLVSIIGAILFFSTLCIAGELQEEQQKNQ